jgi:pimeloyl-ACP methyl ester carboxylesterase
MSARESRRRVEMPTGAGTAAFITAVLFGSGASLLAPGAAAQQTLLDAPCVAVAEAPVTEPETGRTFLLDYPCDLRSGEPVTLVLNLHGGGSSGTWQRRYFPAFDYTDEYRLVVASPYSPTRRWSETDDGYLQNIVDSLVDEIGAQNVERFWLVGHSQGGSTSRRLVCTPFFESRVDGFLSLSGGRLGGGAPRAPDAGRPRQADDPPPEAQSATPTPAPSPPAEPACDFSHIFAIGEHEITSLPTTSALAQKYGCQGRFRLDDVVDTAGGYVHDGGHQNPGSKAWGLLPRAGVAQVFHYPGCADGRVVADVVRIDKGHTEGLEPAVTEELVRLMVAATGGKIQQAR